MNETQLLNSGPYFFFHSFTYPLPPFPISSFTYSIGLTIPLPYSSSQDETQDSFEFTPSPIYSSKQRERLFERLSSFLQSVKEKLLYSLLIHDLLIHLSVSQLHCLNLMELFNSVKLEEEPFFTGE